MASQRGAQWWHLIVLLASFLVAVAFFDGYNGLTSALTPSTQDIPSRPTSRPVSSCSPVSLGLDSRHLDEHRKLLRRMEKPKGDLKQGSPRHRLLTALHGFYRYQRTAGGEIDKIRQAFEKNVKKEKRELINAATNYDAKIKCTEELVRENDRVAQDIVDCALDFYDVDFNELSSFVHQAEASGKQAERVSVSQALKHYVRDWAGEGEHERSSTFPQIIETLERYFPERLKEEYKSSHGDHVRVLVPGSGVGRLAHDIAGLGGFEVTANEWSMYMNLAYRYVTSRRQPNTTTVYPFVDWWSHQPTTKELHRVVSFPDVPVDPSDVLLVEGDFTTAFNERGNTGRYDAVVTLFFIDTARNALSYMETIHRVLKPGGLWINLGPLLYGSGPFVQLSLEEMIDLAEAVGFEFLETDPQHGDLTLPGGKGFVRQKEAPYGFNQKALWKNAYWGQHWIARRAR